MLAFVHTAADFDTDQAAFVREVRDWAQGQLTGDFESAETLGAGITGALHAHEMAEMAGPFDEGEVAIKAADLLLHSAPSSAGPQLVLVVASGPSQSVLRPSQLDDPTLHDFLQQQAMFGGYNVLDAQSATRRRVIENAIVLSQDGAEVLVDRGGSIRITLAAQRDQGDRRSGMSSLSLIQEDLIDATVNSLRYADAVLDHIDSAARLQRCIVQATLAGGSYLGWQTRAEQQESPHSVTVGFPSNLVTAGLDPAPVPRAALNQRTQEMADDLVTTLKRRRSP